MTKRAKRREEAQREVQDAWAALERECNKILPGRRDALEALLIEKGLVTEAEIEKRLHQARLAAGFEAPIQKAT